MISEERKKELNVAATKQQYATTALVLMTCMNVVLGTLMVSRVIPIWLGMFLSFGMMGLVVFKANRDLLDEGETLWESPKDFHKRRREQ